MTNTKLLFQAMANRGSILPLENDRADQILAGSEATADEIVVITEALHLTSEQRDAIFFTEA